MPKQSTAVHSGEPALDGQVATSPGRPLTSTHDNSNNLTQHSSAGAGGVSEQFDPAGLKQQIRATTDAAHDRISDANAQTIVDSAQQGAQSAKQTAQSGAQTAKETAQHGAQVAKETVQSAHLPQEPEQRPEGTSEHLDSEDGVVRSLSAIGGLVINAPAAALEVASQKTGHPAVAENVKTSIASVTGAATTAAQKAYAQLPTTEQVKGAAGSAYESLPSRDQVKDASSKSSGSLSSTAEQLQHQTANAQQTAQSTFANMSHQASDLVHKAVDQLPQSIKSHLPGSITGAGHDQSIRQPQGSTAQHPNEFITAPGGPQTDQTGARDQDTSIKGGVWPTDQGDKKLAEGLQRADIPIDGAKLSHFLHEAHTSGKGASAGDTNISLSNRSAI